MTVLVANLVGVNAMAERDGPEVESALGNATEIILSVIKAHRGSVVNFAGLSARDHLKPPLKLPPCPQGCPSGVKYGEGENAMPLEHCTLLLHHCASPAPRPSSLRSMVHRERSQRRGGSSRTSTQPPRY